MIYLDNGATSFPKPREVVKAVELALASRGIAVRAGLHCAPLAHESAGTLQRGTVRVSFGHDAAPWMTRALLGAAEEAERKFTIGKPLIDHSQK